MPVKFAVKIVRLKVYMAIAKSRQKVYNYDHCQSDDLDLHSSHPDMIFAVDWALRTNYRSIYLHSRSQMRLILDYFLTCNISDNI